MKVVQTTKRSGGDLGAPHPKQARTNSREDRSAGANEFRARHQLVARDRVGAFTTNGEDMQHAIRFPSAGWPTNEDLHGDGEPGSRPERHDSSEVNFSNFPPTHPFTRALEFASEFGATRVMGFPSATVAPQHEFRMVDANGELGCPLVDSHSRVWKLPTRKIQREGCYV